MLQELHIKNIALINEVAISLGTGLNVLSRLAPESPLWWTP